MFVNLHIELMGSEIKTINVLTKSDHITLRGSNIHNKNFFLNIEKKRYVVTRVIYERKTALGTLEYYCYNFNGQSYVICDEKGEKRGSFGLLNWVESLEDIERLDTLSETQKLFLASKRQIYKQSKLNNDQNFFHQFLETYNDRYFNRESPNVV